MDNPADRHWTNHHMMMQPAGGPGDDYRPVRRNLSPEFGMRIRTLRTAGGYGLREFARKVDISPTYLSQVERGEVPPPAEPRVVTIANTLGEDANVLLALAGRIPESTRQVLMRHPTEMTALVSVAGDLSREQLADLLRVATMMAESDSVK